MNEPKVTRPLDAPQRARLFALVQERQELAVLRRIGISRTALMRALAGLPIYGGTRMAIEAGLSSIEAQ
jgi:hypothetical protein